MLVEQKCDDFRFHLLSDVGDHEVEHFFLFPEFLGVIVKVELFEDWEDDEEVGHDATDLADDGFSGEVAVTFGDFLAENEFDIGAGFDEFLFEFFSKFL